MGVMSRSGGNSRLVLLLASAALIGLLDIATTRWQCEAYSHLVLPNPENEGKCIYRDETYKLGENSGFGPCQRIVCHEDGSILIEGCGKLRIASCNRGERINVNDPFPDCCKVRYKCRKPDGSPYYIEKDVSDDAALKAENST